MELTPKKYSQLIIGFLIGFIVKTAGLYFLFYAPKDGTVLENIARSFIMSLIIDVVAWPIMWLMEHYKEKNKRKEKVSL